MRQKFVIRVKEKEAELKEAEKEVIKVEFFLKGSLDSIPSPSYQHKGAFSTLVESLVKMTCIDFTDFFKLAEFTI